MLSLFFERSKDDCLIIGNRLELVLAEQICGFLHHQVNMIDQGFYFTSVAQKALVGKHLRRAHDPGVYFTSLICFVPLLINNQTPRRLIDLLFCTVPIERYIVGYRTDSLIEPSV